MDDKTNKMLNRIGNGNRQKRPCKICQHPNRTDVEQKYLNDNMTAAVAGAKLNVSGPFFSHHMRHHVKAETDLYLAGSAPMIANTVMKKVQDLNTVADALMGRLDKYIMQDGPIDPNMDKSLRGLAAEFRGYIMDLARLEGEFQDAPAIQINKIENQYNNLLAMLVQDLCIECKQKLSQKNLLTNP